MNRLCPIQGLLQEKRYEKQTTESDGAQTT